MTRRARLLMTLLLAFVATAPACTTPDDPDGYYHRSGGTIHSDTFPDYGADAGRYGRHPVGVRRTGTRR